MGLVGVAPMSAAGLVVTVLVAAALWLASAGVP